jgi:hypothetical protein
MKLIKKRDSRITLFDESKNIISKSKEVNTYGKRTLGTAVI